MNKDAHMLKYTACLQLDKNLEKSKQEQLPEIVIKFCRLLSFIDCSSTPKILFTRACRDKPQWLQSGELGYQNPAAVRVPSWLLPLFKPAAEPKLSTADTTNELTSTFVVERATEHGIIAIEESDGLHHFEQYRVLKGRRNKLRADLPISDVMIYLFDILALVLQAFPDSHAELLWEELEVKLWDVIESTCLPLLTVIDIRDVLNHMSSESMTDQGDYLEALLKFLLRISIIMGHKTPPAVVKLQNDALQVLRRYRELLNPGSAEPSRMSLVNTLYLWPLAKQIQNYEHRRYDERLNATLGFALAIKVAEGDAVLGQLSSQTSHWELLSDEMPSTMEILAKAQLQGIESITQDLSPLLGSSSSQFRVLLGFCAIQQESFAVARDILETNIMGVRNEYGKSSLEYLFTGIELTKCYNFLTEEHKGEALAGQVWSDIFGTLEDEIIIHSSYQSYLAIVMADSLLGQAKFEGAEELLLRTLDYRIASSSIIMSSSLRLLKMSRRQRKEHLAFDPWDMLDKAISHLNEVSDVLKYECFEEAMCFISVLDQEEPAQVLRAKAVVDALSRYPIKRYSGTKASKRNLENNILALRRYRTELESLLVLGQQAHHESTPSSDAYIEAAAILPEVRPSQIAHITPQESQTDGFAFNSLPQDTQVFSQYMHTRPALSEDVDDEVKEGVWGYLLPLGNDRNGSSLVLRRRNASLVQGDMTESGGNGGKRQMADSKDLKKEEEAYEKTIRKGIVPGGYLIGRHPECDFIIEDPLVSNRHFLIFTENKAGYTVAVIQDLSGNGTFVNEGLIGRNKLRELNDHDEITILDKARFVFRYPQSREKNAFLQQYTLLEKLGKGHFAEVFLCVEKSSGQRYAAKIFTKPARVEERPKTEYFQQEIAFLMGVSHPNMLCLKDTFDEPNAVYLVLELAAEGELFSWIVMKQKLTEEETRHVFIQLFQGVKYLHDRNMVHRDIKPENILLTDKELSVKLADFGLGTIIGEESFTTTLCGTPSYVAPEILEDTKNRRYTRAVDIWSLGVVLYICLCGFPPFSDELYSRENPYTLTQQIKMGRFDYPSPYWDSVGDPALDLIDRMLTVDVEKRYTIDQCLAHPWTTQEKKDVNDSTEVISSALANLDFSKRKVLQERTLISSVNDVKVTRVLDFEPGRDPVKIYVKNPNSKNKVNYSVAKKAPGIPKTILKEETVAHKRNLDEFMGFRK